MHDENEAQSTFARTVTLGVNLSTLSVSDIDDRVDKLQNEIVRLQEERARKSNSLSDAEAFFKKPA